MVNLEKNDFQDPYIDPGSGCFRNLLGVKDSKILSRIETAFVLHRFYELQQASFDKKFHKTFDFDHFHQKKEYHPLAKPVPRLTYAKMQKKVVL